MLGYGSATKIPVGNEYQEPTCWGRPRAQVQGHVGHGKQGRGTKCCGPEQSGDRSYPHAFESRQSPQGPQGTEGPKGFDGCHVRILQDFCYKACQGDLKAGREQKHYSRFQRSW